jgi:oxygen-independent coproporphyrinogen III oxidase
MAGIYIHIPFCKQACHYCDFYFSTNQLNVSELVDALNVELRLQEHYLGSETIDTIYFGGGTPSILDAALLSSILATIQNVFTVNPVAEITLEANPDDLHPEKLAALKDGGINRLSIGIQTFDDQVLNFLNRAHSANEAIQSFDDARKAGFDNISIDLIYAIPGQDEAHWKKNLELALSLQPEHISAYSLTIEKKTVFGNWAEKGKITPVEEQSSAHQLELLSTILSTAGYHHYEVSNFAKPGFESKHNSSYWRQVNYLGIGPSAHSFNGESRQWNMSNNHLYTQAIQKGHVPAEKELLTRADKVNEYLLTTLRTSWGCNLAFLKSKYDYDLLYDQNEYIQSLTANGLAISESGLLKLTSKGRLLADKIASDLFLVDH